MQSLKSANTNRLIAGLSRKDRHAVLQHCEPIDLTFGIVLAEPSQAMRYVYFPRASFISLMLTVQGHPPLEMGLIGNEGMLGASLLLGVKAEPMRAVVQGAGTAWRMPAVQLRRVLGESSALRRALGRYLYVLMMQLSRAAACIHFHAIEPRLVRWLLMTHDRAGADHFYLTHEFLAQMLGVRRSSISVAAAALQDRKLIRYSRGEIHILDRTLLEAISCECYATMAEDYRQLLG